MCGRYAFALRPSEVRRQFQDANMPADEAPEDDDAVRHSYNFAPGYHGLVYRACVPDTGAGSKGHSNGEVRRDDNESADDKAQEASQAESNVADAEETHYKLQSMKWDYGSMMKTINCRDDSLIESRGMWTSMKKSKRCIVMCQGFYEWLKKNNGKEKIPHFIKRKDGQLMCMAGLWDCVQYEGSDEKHYTYTIITTDSNKQLNFLHDRMPVILENGSDNLFKWLDPNRTDWTKELQDLLKPWSGELEIYPVSKDVGKVGNNSPTFIIPIDSAENKNNIANFFGNQQRAAKTAQQKQDIKEEESKVVKQDIEVEADPDEKRSTNMKTKSSENNAPVPEPKTEDESRGIKRELEETDLDLARNSDGTKIKSQKLDQPSPSAARSTTSSPIKGGRPTRSATSNPSSERKKINADKTPKITKFFGK